MLDFFGAYTVSQIIIFIIGFTLATKGIWDLIDFFKGKYKQRFDHDYDLKKKEEVLEKHYESCKKQHDETMEQYSSLNNKLDGIVDSIEDLTKRVDTLTESDMHDIKQSIVKDYHYFTEKQGWIDDFSMNVIELRYADYKEEGGNSFIDTLVQQLRTLPKHPPAN